MLATLCDFPGTIARSDVVGGCRESAKWSHSDAGGASPAEARDRLTSVTDGSEYLRKKIWDARRTAAPHDLRDLMLCIPKQTETQR